MVSIPHFTPMPDGNLLPSPDYDVLLNGTPITPLTCRVSAMPFNRTWPGYQRAREQTELASFVRFSADEEIRVEVTCHREIADFKIRPLSAGVPVYRKGQVASFTLKTPGFYVFENGDEHFCLHIFFDAIRTFPEKETATRVFGPGIHTPGLIHLADGDRIYIDKDAVVYGSFFGENVHDVHIFGEGIIDGSAEERVFEHCYRSYTKGNFRFYDSSSIAIDGVTLLNSATWCVSFFACRDIAVQNVKIVGQWRYNTDGIDVVNSQNVRIEHCFIRVFDDVITLKGIEVYRDRPVENITVEDCVLWCGWGRTAEVGIETFAPYYTKITFHNCDLIHNERAAIDIQNGGWADVHDVLFEDLRVEYAASALPGIYQETDDMVYQPDTKTVPMAHLICVENFKFTPDTDDNARYGTTHHITYRNIQAFTEDGCPPPCIHIVNRAPAPLTHNLLIDGLWWNRKRIDDLSAIQTEIGTDIENLKFL